MRDGWTTAAIGEIAEPVERSEAVMPGKTYRQVGVRLWGEGAYERDLLDGGGTKYRTLNRTESGDIIVNKIWARNGSVAVVTEELHGCYGSGEFPMFVPDKGRLLPRWFHWITKTRWFWHSCDLQSRGTSGKNRIKPEKFLAIKIPLPPLSEQRRIVAKIDSLAAKIQEAHDLRQLLTDETGALTSSAARQALSEVEARLTRVKDWLSPNRDGIQTGPFGAQLGRSDFRETGVPLMTIGNVQYGGLIADVLKFVSEEKAEQLSRYRVCEGDILFARMGTVGRCCVAPKSAEGWLINYHIIRLALDTSRVDPRFIHWTIRSSADVEQYLSDKIRGATRAGVNSKIVGGLPCRVPSMEAQRRIVADLDCLQVMVDTLGKLQTRTAKELDALLPSILDKAFKGEL